jgi:hypothetical protein
METGEKAYFQGTPQQEGVQAVLLQHVLEVFYALGVNIHNYQPAP